MLDRTETIQEVVDSLRTLSEDDLQFISRIVQVLETQSASDLTEFDRWAMELAKRNKLEKLTEDQIVELVHEYRQMA